MYTKVACPTQSDFENLLNFYQNKTKLIKAN